MKYLDRDNKIHVLFLDNHLCVAVKPAGMVVPIENSKKESLEKSLKAFLQKKLRKENIYLRPMHRLDKPVGGLVVFARSSKAMRRLQEAQRNKEIKKFYIAKVHNRVEAHSKMLSHKLKHGDFKAVIDQKVGKEAKLYYRKVKNSLLSIRLHTGRYHQIRAQLSEIGHPILYDVKYGSPLEPPSEAIALYHTKIILIHPITQKKMTFISRPDLNK